MSFGDVLIYKLYLKCLILVHTSALYYQFFRGSPCTGADIQKNICNEHIFFIKKK